MEPLGGRNNIRYVVFAEAAALSCAVDYMSALAGAYELCNLGVCAAVDGVETVTLEPVCVEYDTDGVECSMTVFQTDSQTSIKHALRDVLPALMATVDDLPAGTHCVLCIVPSRDMDASTAVDTAARITSLWPDPLRSTVRTELIAPSAVATQRSSVSAVAVDELKRAAFALYARLRFPTVCNSISNTHFC